MKIIFLDIDGVLNHKAIFTEFQRVVDVVDPECVRRLNTIHARTGAVICVSSTWRHRMANTERVLKAAGLKVPIIGKTPDLMSEPRGAEIRKWLEEKVVESFVIIDDDTDFDAELTKSFVKTSMEDGGLLDHHVEAAVSILGAKAG